MTDQIITRSFESEYDAIRFCSCYDPEFWECNIVCCVNSVEVVLVSVLKPKG